MKLLINFINFSLKTGGTAIIFCTLDQYHIYSQKTEKLGLFVQPGGLIIERASPVPCRIRTDYLKICSQHCVMLHKRETGASYRRELDGKVYSFFFRLNLSLYSLCLEIKNDGRI
jgi:hypothetical protein